MTDDEKVDKVQCPKCKGMMVPSVVKEGCGGNRTERICPLCGKVISKRGMACCFIATAAYGSPLNENVNVLCSYRDKYLVKNKLGQIFTNFYYDNSPVIAKRIENSDPSKSIVRAFLYPIVFIARLLL